MLLCSLKSLLYFLLWVKLLLASCKQSINCLIFFMMVVCNLIHDTSLLPKKIFLFISKCRQQLSLRWHCLRISCVFIASMCWNREIFTPDLFFLPSLHQWLTNFRLDTLKVVSIFFLMTTLWENLWRDEMVCRHKMTR